MGSWAWKLRRPGRASDPWSWATVWWRDRSWASRCTLKPVHCLPSHGFPNFSVPCVTSTLLVNEDGPIDVAFAFLWISENTEMYFCLLQGGMPLVAQNFCFLLLVSNTAFRLLASFQTKQMNWIRLLKESLAYGVPTPLGLFLEDGDHRQVTYTLIVIFSWPLFWRIRLRVIIEHDFRTWIFLS